MIWFWLGAILDTRLGGSVTSGHICLAYQIRGSSFTTVFVVMASSNVIYLVGLDIKYKLDCSLIHGTHSSPRAF
jgi:hypothetical protein